MANKDQNWLNKHRESIFLIGGVLLGFFIVGLFFLIQDYGLEPQFIPGLKAKERTGVSVLPGPAREKETVFRLTADQSLKLTGMNDPENERWSDLAGNNYSEKFVRNFNYEGNGPRVLVTVIKKSDTLRGRLEAKGLKPNFVYQIKLRGIYRHLESFEKIGYAGRWRFPEKGTNFSDADYLSRKDKSDVEAYLLFDFLVTDKNGNGARDLALDSSLHVLWNASRQRGIPDLDDVLPIAVDAGDPDTYVLPKKKQSVELLWAEKEKYRYAKPDQKRFLPPGKYEAELVLTEESFHSRENDGGYWATVFKGNISFFIEE